MQLTYPQASIGVQQCGTRICHTPCRWLIIYLQPCMSLTAMRYQSVPRSITYKDLEHDHRNTSCTNIQEKRAMTRRTMTSRYDNKINYLLIFLFIFSSFWCIFVAGTNTKQKVNVLYACVECVWNVMAHAQKPDFVFRRNGRVHLNQRAHQFSRLLAAEVCASALVMLDTPRSEVVWEYWLPTPFASFPFTSPPVRHHVSSGFKRTLPWVQKLPMCCMYE